MCDRQDQFGGTTFSNSGSRGNILWHAQMLGMFSGPLAAFIVDILVKAHNLFCPGQKTPAFLRQCQCLKLPLISLLCMFMAPVIPCKNSIRECLYGICGLSSTLCAQECGIVADQVNSVQNVQVCPPVLPLRDRIDLIQKFLSCLKMYFL